MIKLHPARPDDAFLDRLNLGASADAAEACAFFQSRRWFKAGTADAPGRVKPPTFIVRWHDGRLSVDVGLVALTNRKVVRPGGDGAKVVVLSIEVMGVDVALQGRRPPQHAESYATLLMDHLTEHALAAGRAGLALRVWASNARAQRYYLRCGFHEAARFVLDGRDMLQMVKWL